MIYLSYFSKYKGSNGVNISNGGKKFNLPTEQSLVPSWEIANEYKSGRITKKQYRKAYIKQLKKLDVNEIYHRLSGKVLLCYEKPENFCHRQILKEWFNRNGLHCEELMTSEEPHDFYTCLWCSHIILGDHILVHSVCGKTGEVVERPVKAWVCPEWRYSN